jgi:hypothetical protein
MKGKMKLGWVLGASAQVAVPPACLVPPLGTPELEDEVADGDELHAARRRAPTATDATIIPKPVSRRTIEPSLSSSPAPNLGMCRKR